MKKRVLFFIGITLIAAVICSCTAGPNTMAQSLTIEKPAGFLLGIWHGFISLFTFIISLFNKNMNVYEIYNNGGWYNFGFIIGISLFYGGGCKGASHKKRRCNE
ncbi:MAG: hypothetical protein PQJ46_05695 [Spirochaetales bacterium]|nr:hypothetical protein [Spirochaetales bacterium]